MLTPMKHVRIYPFLQTWGMADQAKARSPEAEARAAAIRETLQLMVTVSSFLLGLAALVADIDEDLDTKNSADSMFHVISLGRWLFALMAIVLLGSVSIYFVHLYVLSILEDDTVNKLYTNDASDWSGAFLVVSWIMVFILMIAFFTGVILFGVLFFQLTTYRARGQIFCPLTTDDGSPLVPIIVAINTCDMDNANPDQTRQNLSVPSDLGHGGSGQRS